MTSRKLFILSAFLFISTANSAQKALESVPFEASWQTIIFSLAPDTTQAPVRKPHRVLLFSLFTGFEHWVIPHADEVITILGEKTGAYAVEKSTDVAMFEIEHLRKYDAVVLNNNCSMGERRDLFYDALSKDSTLSDHQRVAQAAQLESNLLAFVNKGGGLAVLHGGIVMQNNSAEFSTMVGGSFDYHPPQQMIEVKMNEPGHPMVQPFNGNSFSHIDEPYFFKNAYQKKDFRPMLYMETASIAGMTHSSEDKVSYVSWIKKYGEGRVFYVSPSHNAQSYENASLLRYYLNGMQYILGDLKCDDTPKSH